VATRPNGRLFTTENIIFLIEQVSTKERSLTAENKRKSTGKFGTGFLTTHLLSERVQVHGYLQDEGENPRSFMTLLDRSGEEKSSIMDAISNSCDMLDSGAERAVDENTLNTKFVYELDNLGVETAKAGLNNLLISIPYVLAFVPELNSISVSSDSFQRIICRGEETSVELENATITKVNILTNKGGTQTNETRYVFVLSNDKVSIATEIRTNDRNVHIIKFHDKLPRIFCDFPLLGTSDFSFPVVVNSPLFNPTEPRDGIPLVQTERSGGDSSENMDRIEGAVSLYNTMLDYFVKKEYKEIYHIVKIPAQSEKNWFDAVWVEQEIIEPIKGHIKTTNLIRNSLGELCSLYKYWGQPNIYIMKDETPEFRTEVWDLSNNVLPAMMTKRDEIEHWYNSLWVECRNYGILDLIERVEEFGNIKTLEAQLDYATMNWLNRLIILFYSSNNKFIVELGRNPSIFPNQYGDFLSLDNIYVENNIGETYKDIAKIAGIDFRERLLDNRIVKKSLGNLKELNLRNVFSELYQAQMDYNTRTEFYKSLINLKGSRNDNQDAFIKIAEHVYPYCFNDSKKVPYLHDKLLSDALKFWRDKICADFSSCETIQGAINQYSFENNNAVTDWISSLISLLVKNEEGNLLDKYSLLPNQYGFFNRRDEIFLDNLGLNEILKDAAKCSGDDVREKLLSRGITLSLPQNRTISLANIAPTITSYVRNNHKDIGKQSSEIREIFRNTSIWIRDNRKDDKVSRYFKELIENFHWFYDDDEIAEGMAKSEQYDDVMKKYNIADINELTAILASHSVASSSNNEGIIISKELLAQWGITSEEELNKALLRNVFGSANIHHSTSNSELFSYVKSILDRSKNNIINFLDKHSDYELDKNNLQFIATTIFRVRKFGQEIYIIARPSDFEQVILYYDTERDLLEYDKDCELWVEDGSVLPPQKITLGKILKLTGINKIPLKEL